MINIKMVFRVTTAAVLTAGVICQFVQNTDPRFPLLYFTVDSALLAALVAICGLRGSWAADDRLVFVRGCAAVGVVFSGLTYAAVIAPATATGTWFQPWDDLWVRSATVLMHGVGPFLVVADFIVDHRTSDTSRPWRTAALWCCWPIGYAVVLVALQSAGIAQFPYPFLQPSEMNGMVPVAGIAIGIAGLMIVLSRLLLALSSVSVGADGRRVGSTRDRNAVD